MYFIISIRCISIAITFNQIKIKPRQSIKRLLEVQHFTFYIFMMKIKIKKASFKKCSITDNKKMLTRSKFIGFFDLIRCFCNQICSLSQTLVGNLKGPVELGNPNTYGETKLCLILFYSGFRSSPAMSLKFLYSWFKRKLGLVRRKLTSENKL